MLRRGFYSTSAACRRTYPELRPIQRSRLPELSRVSPLSQVRWCCPVAGSPVLWRFAAVGGCSKELSKLSDKDFSNDDARWSAWMASLQTRQIKFFSESCKIRSRFSQSRNRSLDIQIAFHLWLTLTAESINLRRYLPLHGVLF